VPRELVDEVVLSCGRKEIRRNKLPARVMVYFVMAMALFYGDSYEEVMRKLAGGLDYLGTWQREWEMPTPGGLCHARQRLGAEVMREIYQPLIAVKSADSYRELDRLMAASGLDLGAGSRPSLYQAAHTGNIEALAETTLAVRQAVHETHKFVFPALADAASTTCRPHWRAPRTCSPPR
jgi:hypothetical protein